MLELIDTFPRFLGYWATARGEAFETQAARYRSVYLAPWPELFEKQVAAYAEDGEDWQAVARERLFPELERRLPAMHAAHDSLPRVAPAVLDRARRSFDPGPEVVFVLYVGLGLGAGWATELARKPAVLFGLENIAEEGWQDEAALAGLTAHELGHLVQARLRREAGASEGAGAWWQLYTEGFAQRCEQVILGRESWHMTGADPAAGWLGACRAQAGRLASSFLRAADEGADVRPFFGSWLEVEGLKQTGYFLGQACVARLEERLSLVEIAALSDWERVVRAELRELCEGGGPVFGAQ